MGVERVAQVWRWAGQHVPGTMTLLRVRVCSYDICTIVGRLHFHSARLDLVEPPRLTGFKTSSRYIDGRYSWL
jgi:hypothetical protein